MFNYLRFLIAVLFFSTFRTAVAQITITAADIQRQNTVGTTHTLATDSTVKTINIGAPGTNTWDFSNLTAGVTYTLTSVDPASTPYKTDFPNANIVFHYNLTYMGVASDSYIYNRLDTNYTSLGIVSSGSPLPGTTVVSKIVEAPPSIDLKLPATMGTKWQQTYAETSQVTVGGNPFQSSVSTVTVINTIDGYGTAKMPGGKTVDALRIKRDERINTPSSTGQGKSYSRIISYMIYSNTGDFVSVVAADTVQRDNGQINVTDVSWNGYAVTAVNDKETAVRSFSLEQNYPNPFNPSTSIKYSIPEDSFVELKVFDAIGKEVETLISQNQNKGNYSLNFNAANLPSGIYIARLKAGSFTKSIKMMLMK